jgi:hypothetical protein
MSLLNADQVLALVAAHPHVMGTLDSGACAIQHVSLRVADGADERLDSCPCDRRFTADELAAHAAAPAGSPEEAAAKLLQLGGGQYVSSPTHTLGDLVRDVVGQE